MANKTAASPSRAMNMKGEELSEPREIGWSWAVVASFLVHIPITKYVMNLRAIQDGLGARASGSVLDC